MPGKPIAVPDPQVNPGYSESSFQEILILTSAIQTLKTFSVPVTMADTFCPSFSVCRGRRIT